MARYSRKALEWLLTNYWDIKEGNVPKNPENPNSGSSDRAVYENPIIYIVDVDRGIDRLGEPGRWMMVSSEVTKERLAKIVHRFGARQQLILRLYLLDSFTKDVEPLWRAIKRLQHYMNRR